MPTVFLLESKHQGLALWLSRYCLQCQYPMGGPVPGLGVLLCTHLPAEVPVKLAEYVPAPMWETPGESPRCFYRSVQFGPL